MTSSRFQRVAFNLQDIEKWGLEDVRHANWPVVYLLGGGQPAPGGLSGVYVGESRNVVARMRQHLVSPEKKELRELRVLVDDTFNKSACLDLESYLIRMLAGDGHYAVLNRNDGVVEANYFERARYRDTFDEVFEELRAQGIFTRTAPEIINSDLFKLSPFKALTDDQAAAVEDIVEGLLEDLTRDDAASSDLAPIVVSGEPGTGKTIVAIFLIKLLRDIALSTDEETTVDDSWFSEFFVPESRDVLSSARIGLVVPQQSLRESIRKVFHRTPGLSKDMVLDPFQVGKSAGLFDLLVVDEAHRLNQRANQSSGVRNRDFITINTALFGADDSAKTQLDWIRAKSRHQILLLDPAQSVKPADLPKATIDAAQAEAETKHRSYKLASQMRVRAGDDYVGYIRKLLINSSVDDDFTPRTFPGYDLRLFDDVGLMRAEILAREAEVGLARLVAGYAWEWKTQRGVAGFDIEIGSSKLRWNTKVVDWIASPTSIDEVGSIHTVQGYDLNYAGVIIGPDLRYDRARGGLFVERESYFDKKGKENNRKLGVTYSDDDLLRYISNIYAVLLTRGIRGTYVYVCDSGLRERMQSFLPSPRSGLA